MKGGGSKGGEVREDRKRDEQMLDFLGGGGCLLNLSDKESCFRGFALEVGRIHSITVLTSLEPS